jgi:hypothetical protein
MLTKILIACWLVATTVMFHAAALMIMLNPVLRLTWPLEPRFLPVTWLLVRITWWLIVIHLVEIALWALFFWCVAKKDGKWLIAAMHFSTLTGGSATGTKDTQ